MFNNLELNRQYSKILSLITVTKELEPDDEMQSHLTKYLCVLCSGFIENAIYCTFCDISDNSVDESVVLNYAKSQLYKIQNTNSEKIRLLTKSFNQEWHDPLRDYLQENERAAAINSIFKHRHNIAHGRDSPITINSLEGYLNKAIEVIKHIENFT